MNWFYAKDGHRLGPVDDHELRALFAKGVVQGDTLVWCPALADWQPYAAVATPPVPEGPPPLPVDSSFCVECARGFVQDELLHYAGVHVCAQCKPVFVQRLRQGTLPPTGLQFAGFGRRLLAKMLDWVITAMFQLTLQSLFLSVQSSMGPIEAMLFSMFSGLFGIVLLIVYGGYFVGRYGATPGKMALGLEVVGAQGGKISPSRAYGRAAAELISMFTLYLGYLMIAFDSQHRALHDFICDTRVVRT